MFPGKGLPAPDKKAAFPLLHSPLFPLSLPFPGPDVLGGDADRVLDVALLFLLPGGGGDPVVGEQPDGMVDGVEEDPHILHHGQLAPWLFWLGWFILVEKLKNVTTKFL